MSPLGEKQIPEPKLDLSQVNTKNLAPKWTRFCWWLSRKLGGRSVFGKQDLT